MSDDQRKESLSRLVKALREARDERAETHGVLKNYLSQALPVRTVQDAKDVVAITDQARARNMLATRREEDDCGIVANTEVADITRRDRYVKSPSVRAMKAAKKRDRDGGRSM